MKSWHGISRSLFSRVFCRLQADSLHGFPSRFPVLLLLLFLGFLGLLRCQLPPMDPVFSEPLSVSSHVQPYRQNSEQLKFFPLSEDFCDQKLRELCCLHDRYVSCNVVRYNRRSCYGRLEMIGRCTGLGFARFTSAEHAKKAADFFAKMKTASGGEGIFIEGKTVQVEVALPHDSAYSAQVIVRGIPLNWTISRLKEYFQQFGPIERATFSGDKPENGGRKGYVLFILWVSAEDAVRDTEHNRWAPGGRPVGIHAQHKPK